jgi:hypothetical protein
MNFSFSLFPYISFESIVLHDTDDLIIFQSITDGTLLAHLIVPNYGQSGDIIIKLHHGSIIAAITSYWIPFPLPETHDDDLRKILYI